MTRRMPRNLALLLAVGLAGCATTVPYVGQGPHPQIQRGRPVLLVDTLGNVLAIIPKIILLDWRFACHAVSPTTESYMARYLDSHQHEVGTTQVQLNQYAPHHDLRRLVTNHNVAWPYRLLLGIPTTLVFDVVLPGRLFPWGDYYNPWTDTVHIYSDHPAIGLHELGHSYDINRRRLKGTYAAIRLIPFVDLYQEMQASKEAMKYLRQIEDREQELRAYKILYPAFGTYAGGYLFIPGGSVIGAAVGHVFGRGKAHSRAKYYERLDEQPLASPSTPNAASSTSPAPASAGQTPAHNREQSAGTGSQR
ncbi:MAG: hypothetical protein HYZ92_03495 [Candidatus Omnitrophica bacterium]|nr:hypothetical protein [Candidatus Omnitrophota bacterium]